MLGIDLDKDEKTLTNAYNDPEGVTARFNLNVLHRIKNELRAEIDIDAFEHEAIVNHDFARIEMHLRATHATTVTVGEHTFSFDKNETLHTENSYKYSIDRLQALLSATPWHLTQHWTDQRKWFAACLLSNS